MEASGIDLGPTDEILEMCANVFFRHSMLACVLVKLNGGWFADSFPGSLISNKFYRCSPFHHGRALIVFVLLQEESAEDCQSADVRDLIVLWDYNVSRFRWKPLCCCPSNSHRRNLKNVRGSSIF